MVCTGLDTTAVHGLKGVINGIEARNDGDRCLVHLIHLLARLRLEDVAPSYVAEYPCPIAMLQVKFAKILLGDGARTAAGPSLAHEFQNVGFSWLCHS